LPQQDLPYHLGCLQAVHQQPQGANAGRVSFEELRAYKGDWDETFGQFFQLNLLQSWLPSDQCIVINLQNMEELQLNISVKLAMIVARSKEEASNKVYATADDEQDPGEELAQVDAVQSQQTLFRQQQHILKKTNQSQLDSPSKTKINSKPEFLQGSRQQF
jgi:hypothetical protein